MIRGLARFSEHALRRKALALTRYALSTQLLEGFEELIYHPGMSGNVDIHYQDRHIKGAVCCTPAEAMLMYHAARLSQCRNALEIGSYIGWSSAHLAKGLSGKLTCIDPFMETDGSTGSQGNNASLAHRHFLLNMERSGLLSKVCLIRDKSPEAIPAVSEGRQWDFIFVDGWHLQGQPLKDVIGVLPYVSQDAVMLLHDLWIADVRDALLFLVVHGWSFRIFDTANYLTVLWRGQPSTGLVELFGLAESQDFVLPAARGRKFIFGLVDDSIETAKTAFRGSPDGV